MHTRLSEPVSYYTDRQRYAVYLSIVDSSTQQRYARVPTTSTAQTIANQYGERASHISSFEVIYVQQTTWGFECVTILNNSTEEERFALYDLELGVREQHPNLKLYFEIVDREGLSQEAIPTRERYDGLFEHTVTNA